jgi:hypothetical protein
VGECDVHGNGAGQPRPAGDDLGVVERAVGVDVVEDLRRLLVGAADELGVGAGDAGMAQETVGDEVAAFDGDVVGAVERVNAGIADDVDGRRDGNHGCSLL